MQLNELLETFRKGADSEREKGDYFERLVRVFLENDNTQKQFYSTVLPFPEWAKINGWNTTDIGIDLVATLADGSGYAAIQCKFYAPSYSMQKSDLDSFVSAASNDTFARLVIADTTRRDFSRNALEMLDKLSKDWNRIGISDLENSRIDWSQFIRSGNISLAPKKTLRDHQRDALTAVTTGLEDADRGKMIMACGTGKTFTGLRIAETIGGAGKRVLFMVPSLALMSQTVREWKNDCQTEFTAFSACSDKKVGRKVDADSLDLNVHDLAFPATTDPAKLALQVSTADPEKMIVIFSTYHSIDVLTRAQQNHHLPEFDLVICDEAHRTTGVTLKDEDDSTFVRIHSNDYVAAKKRLYMTATPRIFGDGAKRKADDNDAELASMDDEAKFGKDLFHRGFGWAVENDLLTDYKVVVLAVDEGLISNTIQNRLKDGAELTLDDATKIIGCYKALTKADIVSNVSFDPQPMRRALAFCQTIAKSKIIEDEFAAVANEYTSSDLIDQDTTILQTEVRHVDGTFNASARDELLNWLKTDTSEDTCRILTNAKVLSEGVDVPSLDAIMFMHPRKSQIDVVQSVGRVMRRAEGKKLGYVILPVAIPPNVEADKAMNENERYQVVWQILNALRAHDERLDARINQAKIGEDISDKVEIVRISSESELNELTAVVDDFATTKTKASKRSDIGKIGPTKSGPDLTEIQGELIFDEFTRAIMAKIVEKCGTREYWDKWAKDIAKIAETHITRISTIVAKEGAERVAFMAFLAEIRDDLNPEVSENDAIEMLAQHLITKPVFDTLFRNNSFTSNNAVSKAMETVLDQLNHHNIGKEAETLQGFYDSVRRQSEGITTATGRQALVVRLYDQFFRSAFPAMTQKLGIVYTPVEVVDFIIHSVNDVLKSEFGQTLGSKGVHILDPFTGTGTFITRLLQSGLIKPEELEHKYKHEIHANEIVLLAYYIAAINIEAVYHDMAKEHAIAQGDSGEDMPYAPFDGIVLTDTFQLYEQDKDMIADLLPDNSERRTAQKERDIRVIVGNPPYSAGQKEESDGTAKTSYANLDAKITSTYATRSRSNLRKGLYDSYIRAIRWASDRIGDSGIAAFVTGSAWIERGFADGMRRTLVDEFSTLYIFHLRGDIRKDMLSKGASEEGQNIFGSGSMTGASIAVLVKNGNALNRAGAVKFHDIGNGLSQKDKLATIRKFSSVSGITEDDGWTKIIPDENGDWLDQTDKSFEKFIIVGEKRDKIADKIFENYSLGIVTNRDAWCVNASRKNLQTNVTALVGHYQSELMRLKHEDAKSREKKLDTTATKISWSHNLKQDFFRGKELSSNDGIPTLTQYRPFTKSWLFFSRRLNERVYQMPSIFPTEGVENKVIHISGKGARSGFSVLMSACLPDIQNIDNGQCFPLKLYEPASADDGLFATSETGYTERDGISDAGLKHFQDAYAGEQISKEDLFYYIYGLLHSPDYRERFKNNLSKELPRIPAVKTAADFWAFSKAGRALGDLHVNYESVEPYMVTFKEGDHKLYPESEADPVKFYRVKKMKFGGKGKDKDKTSVIYNDWITMQNIPLEAYDYIVNGKPALNWVMERQRVKTDNASGIVNDANDYANETVGDPRYPLDLFCRVITVSLETMKIVNALPALDID